MPVTPQRPVVQLHQKTWLGFFMDLVITTVPLLIGSVLMKKVLKQMDPGQADEDKSNQARNAFKNKLKRNGRSTNIPPTNRYEEIIIADMVFPDQIDVTWKDVGGMLVLKEQIYETVVLPLQNPNLFAGMRENPLAAGLATVPRGILFYGPPGTGKTMLAKVIAKDCGATFINVRQSTLQNKWFGESQKLVRGLFSIARKCAPTIIFLDEIDLFFRERSGSDHEVTSAMKSEFMSLWDGLTTSDKASITVLGATNRPFDIDVAILRRLPRTFLFDLPTLEQRKEIVQVQLQNQRKAAHFDLGQLAGQTEGYSGSDLKELCKYAALLPVRRLIREQRAKDIAEHGPDARTVIAEDASPAPLCNADMDEGLQHVRPTGSTSYKYHSRFETDKRARSGAPGASAPSSAPSAPGAAAPDLQQLQQMMEMLAKMSSVAPANDGAAPGPPPAAGADRELDVD